MAEIGYDAVVYKILSKVEEEYFECLEIYNWSDEYLAVEISIYNYPDEIRNLDNEIIWTKENINKEHMDIINEKNKKLVLNPNVSPKTKKRIFRELLSLHIEKSIDGDLNYETILWRIRECPSGLMFQFSDGTINTLILKQNDAIWKENEKRSIILKDKPKIKKQLKKRIMRCYYDVKTKQKDMKQ